MRTVAPPLPYRDHAGWRGARWLRHACFCVWGFVPAAGCQPDPSSASIDAGPDAKNAADDAAEAEAGLVAHRSVDREADLAPLDGGEPLTEQDRFALALTGHRRKAYTGDLDNVQRRRVLRVIVRNNSTSYFLYKGVEAGFDYDLAKWLANDMGVRLEMVVAPTRRELVPWLLDGKGDVILAGLSTDAARADRVAFTRAYLETPWVVVAKKKTARRLKSIADLKGVPLLVKPSSGAMRRLRDLNVAGLDLHGALEGLESEDLLDSVSDGTIKAAVVEGRLANVELMYRSDLAIAFELPGGNDVAAIAVRTGEPQLLAFIDAWLEKNRKSTDWNIFYKRIHESQSNIKSVHNEALRADRNGRISPFDAEFKAAASTHDLDWRLLAAQAYQESRFDVSAKSSFGAVGLMQFLPSTAKELGCADARDPKAAIEAAGRYMGKLMHRIKSDGVVLKDRVRFALASYNAGPGHLDDARILAKEQGFDPNLWFGHVEKAFLLLSKPRYYQNAKHGFARADETVKYVSQIQTRYDAYVALTEGKQPDK
jgi:membrane-bound lytic murein transglycosylase F